MEPRPPVLVPSQLSVLLPVLVCASDVSRTLLLRLPTAPVARVVVVVVGCRCMLEKKQKAIRGLYWMVFFFSSLGISGHK